LRTLKLLNVPTATYISETSIHPIWRHHGADRHFSNIKTAAPIGKLYGVDIHPVTLVADPSFQNCRIAVDRASIRNELRLSADGTVVLVIGGSLGLGQIVASVEAVLSQLELQVNFLYG
jgi:processive 1,2-diacylglycerol beta-glucosyltransferase